MTAFFNCFFYRNKPKGLYIMKYNIKLKMITTMTQKQLVEIFRNGR